MPSIDRTTRLAPTFLMVGLFLFGTGGWMGFPAGAATGLASLLLAAGGLSLRGWDRTPHLWMLAGALLVVTAGIEAVYIAQKLSMIAGPGAPALVLLDLTLGGVIAALAAHFMLGVMVQNYRLTRLWLALAHDGGATSAVGVPAARPGGAVP